MRCWKGRRKIMRIVVTDSATEYESTARRNNGAISLVVTTRRTRLFHSPRRCRWHTSGTRNCIIIIAKAWIALEKLFISWALWRLLVGINRGSFLGDQRVILICKGGSYVRRSKSILLSSETLLLSTLLSKWSIDERRRPSMRDWIDLRRSSGDKLGSFIIACMEKRRSFSSWSVIETRWRDCGVSFILFLLMLTSMVCASRSLFQFGFFGWRLTCCSTMHVLN